MQSALDIAGQQARRAGATQIHTMRMQIGRLSGVVPEALRFAFDSLKAGTAAADAELEIEEVLPACWCPHCKAEFSVEDFVFLCPHCQEPSVEVRRGRELNVASLEIS